MSEYKLVPVEPTPEMIRAGRDYMRTEAKYSAMLDAAPTPEAEPSELVKAADEIRDLLSKLEWKYGPSLAIVQLRAALDKVKS